MSHEASASKSADQGGEVPAGTLGNLLKYLQYDLLSGFLVFLIALPLCLGISLAYGFPPIAGIFTAIIGGIVTTFISNSELTIKGPAAGLIVIVAGCTSMFGGDGMVGGWSETDQYAYRAALAVGVAAGVIQILFGVFKIGSLGEFFPLSVVHGMLAAIGVIIILKQVPLALGVTAKSKEILPLVFGMREIFRQLQREIAIVGGTGVAIMFLWPLVKVQPLKKIPAAIVVLLVTIPLGKALKVDSLHTNLVVLEHAAKPAEEGSNSAHAPAAPAKPDTMVTVPAFGETFQALTLPEFSALKDPRAWKWVALFAIIGTLESMLSAKAVDTIDPWKRKTNLDRDNLAVGVASTLCAAVGATPMISEIVRSRANIDNGARTRFADMFHGLFLLSFVTLLPFVIGMIPIAALAAMLVYTGFRLAHPREFAHVYHIGPEQLVIFVSTIVGVLATDLLIGVGIGIVVKIIIHIFNGVPFMSFFKPYLDVIEEDDQTYRIVASHSAVFSNWILFRRQIINAGIVHHKNVIVDLSDTRLVDHTVMEKLHDLQRDFEREELKLEVVGLDNHRPFSSHPQSARKRPA